VICIDPTGRITLFNPSAAQMFGYGAEEVLDRNVRVLMPWPQRDEHDSYIRDYRETGVAKAIGRTRHVEARRKNGEIFPIELSVSETRVAKEILYTAIIRDVTERKKAEKTIETRVRQQAVVAELGLRALGGAPLSELMDEAARAVAKALAVEYCKILELLPDGGSFRLRAGVGWKEGLVGRATVSAGADSQAGYTLHSGAPVIVEDLRAETRFRGPPLLHDHGVVSGMSAIIHGRDRPFGVLAAHSAQRRVFTRDDTHCLQAVANVLAASIERVRAEEWKRQFQQLAQQRERLADMGAIAAKIVHDVGNPVAALILQAEVLLRRAARDPGAPANALKGPAERIHSEVRRLDQLVSEFRDFTRQQRLDLRTIELSGFLETVVELWRPVAAERQIALELDVLTSVPCLRADEGKLRRVMDNLIKNAVEAIPAGPGRIRIQMSKPTPETLRISIRDSGTGIPAGVDVFRLFETTKPDGFGLGLSIARRIAVAHGGNLEVEQLRPHGTTFHLDLPVQVHAMH
jgi:PAS domain S-box-containing protein